MTRLYLPYFIYGFLVFYMNLSAWEPPGAAILVPVTLFSALVLFLVASGLALFYARAAAILGSICLAGALIFQIYLVSNLRLSDKGFGAVILLMSALYMYATVKSVKGVINRETAADHLSMRKPVRFFLAFLPVLLLLFWFLSLAGKF